MKSLKTAACTVGIMCLLGSLVFGAELSQRGPISFDIYDTNKDGKLSKVELLEGQNIQMQKKRSSGGQKGQGQGMSRGQK